MSAWPSRLVRALRAPFDLAPSVSLSHEIFSGLTLVALGLPAVMGYSLIAGMPLVTGLYSFLLPLLVFVFVGSSKSLIVAADSATAAILAAGLVGLAPMFTSHYVSLAATVAVLVGIALLLVRLLHLGFIANFLSRTILVGFLAGVGIQVAITQLPTILDIHTTQQNPLAILAFVGSHLRASNILSLLIATSSLALLVVLRRFSPKIPAPFVVVSLGVLSGWLLAPHHLGLAFVPSVPAGLPLFHAPSFGLKELPHLIGLALSLVVVIIAQSSATSRAFEGPLLSRSDSSSDITGLALSNVAAGLSGGYVVNSSPTRAGILQESGSSSKWPMLTAAAVTVLVLLFFTAPLHFLPLCVLAAIVVYVAIRLVDLKALRHIASLRWDEFVVAAVTAASVVVLGVQNGIVLAMVLAVINHLRRGYAPSNFLVVLDDDNSWLSAPISSARMTKPGIFVYRFQASLWYANVSLLVEQIQFLTTQLPSRICLDFSSVAAIDYSAGLTLLSLLESLPGDIDICFTHVDSPVLDQLTAYQVVPSSRVRVLRSTRDALDLPLDNR